MTLLFSYMGYRKHYLLIKKSINKDFPNYQKRYSFNLISKKYQVDFILEESKQLINFAILPGIKYQELKQKIENYISFSFSKNKKCGICDNTSLTFCHCPECFFIMCLKCSDRLYIENCFIFNSPNCDYFPTF